MRLADTGSAFSFHATEFALTSSVLRRPVAVGACMNVRGVCFSENFWFGVYACPLPRISVTDIPCEARPTLAFTVVAVRS